jgi:hypothetical protein
VSSDEYAVLYEDDFGFAGPGHVFYPAALRQIAEVLAELNRDEILQPASFNANIRLYLDLILGRFRSFHDTHRAAQSVHSAYRRENRQYCLYLRSFVLGGVVLGTGVTDGRLTQQQGLVSSDRTFREFLKAALPRGVASISFINTFDLYPSGNEAEDAVDYMRRSHIPSFRVLSHNWKDIVKEVARGAKLIVVNAEDEGRGIDYELDVIRECGMADRTIVARRLGKRTDIDPSEFHDVIDSAEAGLASGKLAPTIRALAADDFKQTNDVTDLSGLRCWVVDRQIDAAAKRFDAETLSRIAYDHYIPSSLASNWTLLTERFPKLLDEWRAIESKAEGGDTPGTEELTHALYAALEVFYIAVTLERYYEMAIALSTIGMAHRAITSDKGIMTACYRHAARCAEWDRNSALTAFLTDALMSLEGESENDR